MNILESFITGVSEILSHKFQSILTMLGIIFGVAAVISMVSIGEGAQKEAIEQLKKLGTDTIIIKRIESPDLEKLVESTTKSPYGIELSQTQGLKEIIADINSISAIREIETTARGIKREFEKTTILGVEPNIIESANIKLKEGRFITKTDIATMANVCVLGSESAKQLFLYQNPIGQKIETENRCVFTCIGVLDYTPSSSLLKTTDYNKAAFIPISTSSQKFVLSATNENALKIVIENQQSETKATESISGLFFLRTSVENAPLSLMLIKVKNIEKYKELSEIITNYLTMRTHGIKNFEIIVPIDLLRKEQETQRIFNIVMGAIASISLLVGGIGIMNIMLATVTQRTREIGIRRCLGATKFNILFQFIIESLIICLMGGLIGIVLGVLLASTISNYAKWQTVISYTAIIYAIGVSTLTGVVFGLYPAWKAASTNPITALKSE